MKRNIVKSILYILLVGFCFGLVGCSSPTNALISDDVISDATVNNGFTDDTITTTDSNLNLDKDSSTVAVSKGSLIFKEISETVYAKANVNVRFSYTTVSGNIKTVLKKGSSIQRVGINKEWSKVSYQKKIYYIKTEYLTTKKPVSNKTNPTSKNVALTQTPSDKSTDSNYNHTDTKLVKNKDFVTDLKLSSKINQLICVVGKSGPDCNVSFHVKDKDGKWTQQFSTAGNCGSKGITYNKKEGDGKTPAGLFSFTISFGIKSDPGAKLSYRQITDYDYWVDDSKSPYYNTWVNSLEIPGNYSSEHLIKHSPQYNYALNINYNPDCTPGLGSAIFLHGFNGLGKTTGCIAIAEKYVKSLVQQVDSSTRILIVQNKDDLTKY